MATTRLRSSGNCTKSLAISGVSRYARAPLSGVQHACILPANEGCRVATPCVRSRGSSSGSATGSGGGFGARGSRRRRRRGWWRHVRELWGGAGASDPVRPLPFPAMRGWVFQRAARRCVRACFCGCAERTTTAVVRVREPAARGDPSGRIPCSA